MNILIFVDTFNSLDDPTSKIVRCFADCLKSKKYNITICTNDCHDNVNVEAGHNVFGLSKRKNVLYKTLRKIYSFIYPRNLFPYLFIKNPALKIAREIKPNLIISFSGAFWTQKIGAFLSEKLRIKFISFYTDPFSSIKTNPADEKPQKMLERIEKKWMAKSSKIIMPSNYLIDYVTRYKDFKSLFSCLELPSFLSDDERLTLEKQQPDDYYLYAGGINSQIRDPSGFINFARYFYSNFPKYHFLILTNSKINYSMPPNIKVSKRKNGDDYLDCLSKAKGIIIIDNNIGIQIPSKVIESISTGKPIVFFYKNTNSYSLAILKKYKNAILINTNNSEDFSFAANKLLQTEKMSREDIDDIFPSFLLNNILFSFCEIIKKIIKE